MEFLLFIMLVAILTGLLISEDQKPVPPSNFSYWEVPKPKRVYEVEHLGPMTMPVSECEEGNKL